MKRSETKKEKIFHPLTRNTFNILFRKFDVETETEEGGIQIVSRFITVFHRPICINARYGGTGFNAKDRSDRYA